MGDKRCALRLILMPALVVLYGSCTCAQPGTRLPADPPSVQGGQGVNDKQGRTSVAATDHPSAADRVTGWRDSSAENLARLADEFARAGRSAEAQQVRDWVIERPADRQLLFLRPHGSPPRQLAETEADPLAQQFAELRKQRAEQLYRAAHVAAEVGNIERAYQLVFEVLAGRPRSRGGGKDCRHQA